MPTVAICMHEFVCEFVRACVRGCVRACVRACVRVNRVQTTQSGTPADQCIVVRFINSHHQMRGVCLIHATAETTLDSFIRKNVASYI